MLFRYGFAARLPAAPTDPVQLIAEIARGLPAGVGILGEALFDDSIERGGGDRLKLRDRRRLRAHDRRDQTRLAFPFEGLPTGEHLEEHGTESEQIRASVDVFAFELLGRHVLHGAEDRPRVGERLVLRRLLGTFTRRDRRFASLRKSEVKELDPRFSQHDVARLQVTMHEAHTVRFVERVGDLSGVHERLIEGQSAFLQSIRKRLSFDVLHDEKVDTVVLPDIVKRADVWMVQARHRPRLALEALAQCRIFGEMLGKNFDGDAAPEPRVTRLVDFAHPARPER